MSDVSRVVARVREELLELSAYEVPHPPEIRAKLDANESPFELPADVAAELGRELARVPLNRYPAADGGELRRILSARHDVPPETLCFGNGSDELIAMLLSTFARPREGQERAVSLYPVPTFGVFRLASIWSGVDPVEIPLGPEFALDEEALAAGIEQHRPNVVFFARPNNPTGTLWPVEAVIRTAELYPDTVVVHDEAYADYGGESLFHEVARLPNLVCMRTLSKVGMAALRVGYLHADPALIRELDKLRPPYNVGALNQRAAVFLLQQTELLERHRSLVVAERDKLRKGLGEIFGVRPYDSHANLILIRVANAPDVWRGLCERGVLVRNLHAPGPLEGCLRVTVGTPEENQLFLDALREIVG